MKTQQILNLLSEKYDNLRYISYDEILKKHTSQELKGIPIDVIGSEDTFMFFSGIRKTTPSIKSIFSFSKKNHNIQVLAFCYLYPFRPQKANT